MKITQLRNATMTVEFGEHVVLVDPMLAPKGSIPSLKYVTRSRRRNPLVDLPPGSQDVLDKVTACLITHCQKGHFDHLDRAGVRWLREHEIPVYCPQGDVPYLSAKGLKVHGLSLTESNAVLGASISLVPCIHGRGAVGKFMAHGYGFYIEQKGEPSLYLAGDTILSDEVSTFVRKHGPDVSVIPAGGARFDLGAELIMDLEQAMAYAELSPGIVLLNHLEALDHCPVSRAELHEAILNKGLQQRVLVPNDGAIVCIGESTVDARPTNAA